MTTLPHASLLSQPVVAYEGQVDEFFVRSREGILPFRIGIAAALLFGIAWLATGKIGGGQYLLKISCGLLILPMMFHRHNRLALVALVSQIYFPVKFQQYVTYTSGVLLSFAGVVVLFATIWAVFQDSFSERRSPPTGSTLPSILLFAWLGLASLQVLNATSVYMALYRLSPMTGVVCAFFLISRTRIDYEMLRRGVIALGVGLVAFVFSITVGGILGLGHDFFERAGSMRGELAAQGNLRAAMMVVAAAFGAGLAASTAPRRLRVIALLLIPIPATLVVLAHVSRGAMVALMLIVPTTLLLSNRKRAALFFVVFAVVILGGLLYVVFPEYLSSLNERMSQVGVAAQVRMMRYKTALGIGTSYPILGCGAGQYWFRSPDGTQHAHNDLLNIVAEHGFVGLSLVLIAGGMILVRIYRAWRSPDPFQRSVLFGVLMAAMAYLLMIQVYVLYWHRAGILMAALAGLAYSVPASLRESGGLQEYAPVYEPPPSYPIPAPTF